MTPRGSGSSRDLRFFKLIFHRICVLSVYFNLGTTDKSQVKDSAMGSMAQFHTFDHNLFLARSET